MSYPISRLIRALKGYENELIELTLLLQQSELAQNMDLGHILQTQYNENKTQHVRYLFAWYCINNKASNSQDKLQAEKVLEELANEKYLLAENFQIFMNKTNTISDSIAQSKNPLIVTNLVTIASSLSVKQQFEKLASLYLKLDNNHNRYMRQNIAHIIANLSTTEAESIRNIRKFFIENNLYAHYWVFMEKIQQSSRDQDQYDELWRKSAPSELVDTKLEFTKKELLNLFDNLDNLNERMGEKLKELNHKSSSRFTLDQLQEELYYFQSILDRKIDAWPELLNYIKHSSEAYAKTDPQFNKRYENVKINVTNLLKITEMLSNNLQQQLRYSAGTDPANKKLEQTLQIAVETNASTNYENIKFKEEVVKVSEKLKLAEQLLEEQAQTTINSYNMLLLGVIAQLSDASEVVDKLKEIQLGDLKSLTSIQSRDFSNKWAVIFADVEQDNNPLKKVKPLLQAAWTMISPQITKKDSLTLIHLTEKYNKLLTDYQNTPISMWDRDDHTLITMRNNINKIADLKLDGATPNFLKANQYLNKMSSLITTKEKVAKLYDKNKLEELRTVIRELEDLHQIKNLQKQALSEETTGQAFFSKN